MHQWKPVLLLPLCLCFDSEVTLDKTIGKETDVTPVCANEAQRSFLVLCKISTERTRGEVCRLLYQHEYGFVSKCDPRFTLEIENQTVFLRLTSLTPVDSGSYTCECSRLKGTKILYVNITVEGSHEVESFITSSWMWSIIATIATIAIIAIIATGGVVLGVCILRKKHRDDTRSEASGLPACETLCSLDQDDLYRSLRFPTSDVYHNISSMHHRDDTKRNSAGRKQETDKESDQHSVIYENI